MELKYILPSLIAFILSLVAFVPMVKWRLKSTETINDRQEVQIQRNKDDNHRLELLILEKDRDSTTKSIEKMAEALNIVAEGNSKFQSLLEGQTELINKAYVTSNRAHERLDEHAKGNDRDFKDMTKELVSHKYFDDVIRGISQKS